LTKIKKYNFKAYTFYFIICVFIINLMTTSLLAQNTYHQMIR